MKECFDTNYFEMKTSKEWFNGVCEYIDYMLCWYDSTKEIEREWDEIKAYFESSVSFDEKLRKLIFSKTFGAIIGEVIDFDEGVIEVIRKCYNEDAIYLNDFKLQKIIDKIYDNQYYQLRNSKYYESWEDNDANSLKDSRDELYYLLNSVITEISKLDKENFGN